MMKNHNLQEIRSFQLKNYQLINTPYPLQIPQGYCKDILGGKAFAIANETLR